MRIDLNADVGEGYEDEEVIALVSTVSIACGAHAGDEETMDRAVAAALKTGAAVGAHPGYPDRAGFGRRRIPISDDDLVRSIVDQVRALASVAARRGVRLAHVKPHGALYNEGADDPSLAALVADATRSVDPALRVMGLAGSELMNAATAAGISGVPEAFADRRYLANGRLAPRAVAGAVIDGAEEASRQAVAIVQGRAVETIDGSPLTVHAETICIHADTPGALANARAIRDALERAGVAVMPSG